jgi:hypothetical protein
MTDAPRGDAHEKRAGFGRACHDRGNRVSSYALSPMGTGMRAGVAFAVAPASSPICA